MAKKYSKKAQSKVKRAMHERKRGTLRSGRLGQEGDEPQAGDCDRPVRGAPRRGEGPEEAQPPQGAAEARLVPKRPALARALSAGVVVMTSAERISLPWRQRSFIVLER